MTKKAEDAGKGLHNNATHDGCSPAHRAERVAASAIEHTPSNDTEEMETPPTIKIPGRCGPESRADVESRADEQPSLVAGVARGVSAEVEEATKAAVAALGWGGFGGATCCSHDDDEQPRELRPTPVKQPTIPRRGVDVVDGGAGRGPSGPTSFESGLEARHAHDGHEQTAELTSSQADWLAGGWERYWDEIFEP